MTPIQLTLLIVATTFLVTAISLCLATLGEPQSLWLWRDVLGVIQ